MSLAALWGLFLAAFAAATLLPAQSELALAGLLATGHKPVWLLIAVAAAGNTLGAADRRWFPVKKKSLGKAETWYRRYGRWSLLLSWAPVIGDPLTLAAGLLREPFGSFSLIVGLAKLGRYLVVAGAALRWLA